MKEQSEYGWAQIVTTAVLTCLLTIVAGVVVYYVTREKAELRYSITRADPFYGSSAATSIYKIEITNSGKKEVEDFRADISFPTEKISDSRVSASGGAIITEKLSDGSDLLSSDLLNPGDKVEASFLVTFGNVPVEPRISVRAKGVTGALGTAGDRTSGGLLGNGIPVLAGVFVSVLLSGGLSSIVLTRLRASSVVVRSSHHSRRGDLALGFFSVGLRAEGEKLLQLRRCVYWSQSDRIAASYTASGDLEDRRRAAKALEFVLDYSSSISSVSKDILNYNIATLWLSAGNEGEALARLVSAAANSSEFVLMRLLSDRNMVAFATKERENLPEPWRRKLSAESAAPVR